MQPDDCVLAVVMSSSFVGVCACYAASRAFLAADVAGGFDPDVACTSSPYRCIRERLAGFPAVNGVFALLVEDITRKGAPYDCIPCCVLRVLGEF